MNLLSRKLSDFQPIELEKQDEVENYFDLLNGILKKINKTGQKSSNTLSSLKEEILSEVGKTSDLMNDLRDSRMSILNDNEKLEKSIIEYNDIIENLNRAAKSTSIPELSEMTNIAVKALDQVNAKVGITRIPSDANTNTDPEYHIILNTVDTDNLSYSNQIANTLESGYRRGEKVLRRSSVSIYKIEDEENE